MTTPGTSRAFQAVPARPEPSHTDHARYMPGKGDISLNLAYALGISRGLTTVLLILVVVIGSHWTAADAQELLLPGRGVTTSLPDSRRRLAEPRMRMANVITPDEEMARAPFDHSPASKTVLNVFTFVDQPPAGFGNNDVVQSGVTVTVQNDAGTLAISRTVIGTLFVTLPGRGVYTVTRAVKPGFIPVCAGDAGSCTTSNQPNVTTVVVDVPKGGTGSVLFGDSPGNSPGELTGLKTLEQARPDGRVYVGDTITYTLRITNVGGSVMFNPLLTDTLPSGVQLLSWTAPKAIFRDSVPPAFSAWWQVIMPGESYSATLVVRVLPAAAGNGVTNTFGYVPSGSTAPAPVFVYVPAELGSGLAVTNTASPSVLPCGQMLTWTITLSNGGTLAAVNVIVTDTFPAGFVLAGATPTYVTTSNGIRWFTDVPPLARVSLTVTGIMTVVAGVASRYVATNTGLYSFAYGNGSFAAQPVNVLLMKAFVPVLVHDSTSGRP
jgi:uncharacterized repeat protein (TIGR01451 family)